MRVKDIFILLLLYVVPILILKLYPANYLIRAPLLTLVTGLVILTSRKMNKRNLGFSKITYGLKSYLGLLGLLLAGIFIAKLIIRPETVSIQQAHFYGMFIPISISQEYLFRSFLHAKFREEGFWIFLTISSLLFGFIHMLFEMPGVMFVLTFLGGIAFGYVFYKRPNFWLSSIVHIITNFISVWMGFFS